MDWEFSRRAQGSGLRHNYLMKRFVPAAIALLLLSACGSDAETDGAPTLPSVPSECAKTKILDSFPDRIPNPKFINTEWEPAEGTDLFAAYNAGGIACSYGIQEAEIGATILWAPDNQLLFSELTPRWVAAGQKSLDLPDLDEEKAYVLTEGVEGQEEYHEWAINLLIQGSWIQVAGTFFGSIDEAMPIVKAAVASLRSPEETAKKSVAGCYMAELPKDLYVLNIDYHDNNMISAGFFHKDFVGESTKGLIIGTYTNGILQGTYRYSIGDKNFEQEIFLKGDKSGFVNGSGPISKSAGVEKFTRPLKISWDSNFKYVPAEDCESLVRT
jgi:hypothetical protein